MSLEYLNAAAARGDTEALIRYVRLHVGDGDEAGQLRPGMWETVTMLAG